MAILLSATGAGCGSALRSSSLSTAGRGPALAAVASVSCSYTATSSSRRAAANACVFVLTDGRRFRCSGVTFAKKTPSVALLEHAKSCIPLRRHVLSPRLRAVATRIAVARTCLTNKGLKVAGGPVSPEQGPSSPDGELITTDTFVAFYSSVGKAQRLEPEVIRNAKRFRGQVVRHGAVTILWVRPPGHDLRTTVVSCVWR